MCGSKFPTVGAKCKSKKLPKEFIFLSLIALSKISCLIDYKLINLYYLWVPHGLLQLVHNPQRDIRHDGVVHSGGSNQGTP